MVSNRSEFGLQRVKFCLLNTAFNISHSLRTYSCDISEPDYLKGFLLTELLRKPNSNLMLPQPVTNGLEGYVSHSKEVELNCPIDWFVLMGNNVYDYCMSDDEHFVSIKPSQQNQRFIIGIKTLASKIY